MCFRKTIQEGESVNLWIADDDIVSYKLLISSAALGWRTPYLNAIISFDSNGVAIQETKELTGWIQDWSLYYHEGDVDKNLFILLR